MGNDADAVVLEQIAYYRARAAEYDRVYAERGDLKVLLPLVDTLPVTGDVLELACGTGQWTGLLADRARSVTAVDAAPEALAIAQERVRSTKVRFACADLFAWRPPRRFDTVFFAFWLSHVPPARLPAFWNTVADALTPGGQAVFIDNGREEAASEDVLDGQPVPSVRRRLDDGSEFRVVKVFHEPDPLVRDLAAWGWSAQVWPVGARFIAGTATR
ncbi:class I SAM-dependent methyltransferase [Actinacidiphila acidipaludis]|uniref:Class I SAM-dependent methyltransferase n=1 Tax=Actinacidiphila acidipaludis TaxID=2873382 RepID=A0ABS7QEF4_9ACTN|nr:class I SAM-dependent methyltransferase [Streptomyces acidipaludis]MBY8881206.1 class I SAM-dependent methyltransferase [Streptomyces acidipaludis]